jgi:hypothetical protein
MYQSICLMLIIKNDNDFYSSAVKPLLRGHLWAKKKWPHKTGDLIKEVQFIWYFLWLERKKRWPFDRGDCMNRFDCIYTIDLFQLVLNCSALPCLLHLLSSTKESIRKEACWTISNITAGNRMQIQVCIESLLEEIYISIFIIGPQNLLQLYYGIDVLCSLFLCSDTIFFFTITLVLFDWNLEILTQWPLEQNYKRTCLKVPRKWLL